MPTLSVVLPRIDTLSTRTLSNEQHNAADDLSACPSYLPIPPLPLHPILNIMAKVAAWTALSAILALALAANAAPANHQHTSASTSTHALIDHNADVKRPTFVTDVPFAFATESKQTPHEVALGLAASLLSVKSSSSKLRVRDDSYFDAAHGLHHVYLAQEVNGLSVYNGGLHAVISDKGEQAEWHDYFPSPSLH